MKTILILTAAAVLFCGCQRQPDPALENAKLEMLQRAIKERDAAERENRKLVAQNMQLESIVYRLENQLKLAKDAEKLACGMLETQNARKLTEAKRMINDALGEGSPAK